MRELKIKRTKSFVGCLATMKVYIEDPTSNEITINNTACRKIGELKNGEEKTFEIGEEAAKLFVIADKISKGYCNELYQIPAGTENISLTGKNAFNPAGGNAFRFDGNDNAEAIQNRKSGSKKGLVVLIAALIIGFVVGFAIVNAFNSRSKTFSADGMSITLTSEFKETKMQNFTACYDSSKVAVFALKESFSLLEGFEDYTLEQYGNIVMSGNGLTSVSLKTTDGLTYFEYDYKNTADNKEYQYYSFIYKADDAFWLIQFATYKNDAAKYFDEIIDWASSVKFD